MSQSETERFARDLPTNAALRAEIEKDGGLESTVAAAARHGYSVTREEAAAFLQTRAKAAGKELSDADLATASGSGSGVRYSEPDPPDGLLSGQKLK
jgi:hypothetical protein